jgi:biopolymer transport protein ExbB/TolQ
MIALEMMAMLVTIFGGLLAAAYWLYSRMSALRRNNEELREYIANLQSAPQQPDGADYLQNAQGERLCIRCFNSTQKQWKLIQDGAQWRCPVCDGVSVHRPAAPSSGA